MSRVIVVWGFEWLIFVSVMTEFFIEFIGFFHELAEVLADALAFVADAVDLGVVADGVKVAELGGDVRVEFRTADVVIFVGRVERVAIGVIQREPLDGGINECEYLLLSFLLFGTLSCQLLLPRTIRVFLLSRDIEVVKHRGLKFDVEIVF